MEETVRLTADVDLGAALKRRRVGLDDLNIEVFKRVGADLGYALQAVDQWLAWALEERRCQDQQHHEEGTSFCRRLFFRDALFDELMLRYTLWKLDGRSRWSLNISTVGVAQPWRGCGAFRRLLAEIEARAVEKGLDVIVEAARPPLSNMLARRGYYPVNLKHVLGVLQKMDGNTWVRLIDEQPAQFVYARLPSDVIAILSPFSPRAEVNLLRIIEEEMSILSERLRDRIKREVQPME